MKKFLFIILLLTAGLNQLIKAQGDVDAWPEFDFWFRLNDQDRIYAMASFATDKARSYEESAFGVAWDRRLNEDWSVRASYRYIYTQTEPINSDESRLILDAKYFLPLGNKFLMSNRNRVDLRFLNDADFSFRLRDRLQIERPFNVLWNNTLILWSSFEVWYDSRYRIILNRDRLLAGFTFFFTKWISTDLFYAWQNEINPPEQKDALGVFLGVWIDLSGDSKTKKR